MEGGERKRGGRKDKKKEKRREEEGMEGEVTTDSGVGVLTHFVDQ